MRRSVMAGVALTVGTKASLVRPTRDESDGHFPGCLGHCFPSKIVIPGRRSPRDSLRGRG